jgi:hypothetical protein
MLTWMSTEQFLEKNINCIANLSFIDCKSVTMVKIDERWWKITAKVKNYN